MAILIIIISLLTAVVISLISKRRAVIEYASVAALFIVFVSAISIGLKVVSSGSYGFSQYFSVDAFGAIVIIIISLIGFVSCAYSVSYLREETTKQIIGFQKVKQYFILFNLFILAMFFAAITSNPIIMWIAIEASTLSTAFLISFYNQLQGMEAAWKYLIINSVGLLLGFFGTMLYFTSVASLDGRQLIDWNMLLSNAHNMDPFVAKIAFIFVLIGYGTKIGFFPMHTWKPDTYSNTPIPIASLFSGALMNVAFLALLRFKSVTDLAVGQDFSKELLIFFGLFSIMIAALIIFIQKSYKRLLAYSSIEHAGIIALGFGFGGIGAFAAILHMIYHSLAKSILFLSAGNIFLRYSSTKIAKIRDAISTIPLTAIIFIIGFLAITGIPPFGLFLTKFYILSAGINSHPVITIIALLAFVLVFAGFLKHITYMMFGEKPEEITAGEKNKWLIIPLVALTIIFIYLSLHLPQFISELINSAALNY